MWVTPNFVSNEEIESILSIDMDFSDGNTITNSSSRIVSSMPLYKSWLIDKIENAVEKFNSAEFNYDISNGMSEMNLLKYTPGGKYDWHQDVIWGNKDHRKFTVILQLSDSLEYEGGDFEFRDANNLDMSKCKEKGSLIMFPSIMYHRIKPLTKGTRYSIVSWVNGPRWK